MRQSATGTKQFSCALDSKSKVNTEHNTSSKAHEGLIDNWALTVCIHFPIIRPKLHAINTFLVQDNIICEPFRVLTYLGINLNYLVLKKCLLNAIFVTLKFILFFFELYLTYNILISGV